MRVPTLTISPPIMAGSTLTSRSSPCRRCGFERALERVEKKYFVAERFGDGDLRGGLAPLAERPGCEAADHVAHGKSRRLAVMTRRKMAVMPLMPALSRIACNAFNCSSAPNTGLRPRRLRSALEATAASNCSRSCLTASMAFPQARARTARGVAACHSGDDRVFACHGDARFLQLIHRPGAVAGGRRKLLESKREFRFLRTSRKSAETLTNSRG